MACQSAVLGLNQRLDKHVDARGDSHQDRGSTPLASTILTKERLKVADLESPNRENQAPLDDPERAVSVFESAVPILESAVPMPESTVPVLGSSVPVVESSVLTPGSSVPVPESTVPTPGSAVLVIESSVPVSGSTLPAFDQ
jgi:hypothetical protein